MCSGCAMKLVESVYSCATSNQVLYFVIRSNIDRGSRMKVGRTTLLRSAPGLS